MPTDNNQAGLAPAAQIQGKYVESVTVANGIITVDYGKEAHTTIAPNSIRLTPNTAQVGSVQWDCDSAAIANKHLPAACRT
jgi:type IV pilus assembly protein PilA